MTCIKRSVPLNINNSTVLKVAIVNDRANVLQRCSSAELGSSYFWPRLKVSERFLNYSVGSF